MADSTNHGLMDDGNLDDITEKVPYRELVIAVTGPQLDDVIDTSAVDKPFKRPYSQVCLVVHWSYLTCSEWRRSAAPQALWLS